MASATLNPLAAVPRRARPLQVLAASRPWSQRLAQLLLCGCILYLLIGPTPYAHGPPLDPDTGAAVISPVNRYIWFALLGLAAPLLWLRRAELPSLTRRTWPLLALLGWFTLSLGWSLDPPSCQRRLILLWTQAAICAACVLELRDKRAFHAALAAACAIVVVIDVASWVLLPGLSQTELGLAGIHSHKNWLGLAMMLTEFVCALYALGRRRWAARAFWIAIVLAGFALLVASQSKTSLGVTVGGFVAAPLIIALLRARQGAAPSALAGLVGLATAAVFVWFSWSYLDGRDPFAPLSRLTFTDRTDVWRFVLDQVQAHPIGGVGYASFWDIDPRLQPSLQTDAWFSQPDAPTNQAHDGYLDLLVSTGAVGLAMSLAVLLRWMAGGLALLRAALRRGATQDRAALPYLIFLGLFPVLVAVHNVTESSYFSTSHLFSFLVLLAGLEVDLLRPRPARRPWRRPRPSAELAMSRP